MEQIINEIVEIEWSMFQKTNNIGGRAWCQDDRRQFEINRRAQFSMWDQDSLESYLKDLRKAQQNGQNLVSLKYAYMMEHTSPAEYEAIREQIPEVGEARQQIIDQLLACTQDWCEAFSRDYPKVSRRGRPITAPKGCGITSVMTYAKGEMSTYSLRTLNCLLALYRKYKEEKINLQEAVVGEELRQLSGLALEQIEKQL